MTTALIGIAVIIIDNVDVVKIKVNKHRSGYTWHLCHQDIFLPYGHKASFCKEGLLFPNVSMRVSVLCASLWSVVYHYVPS